jgi:hypothetical protein
VCQGNEPNLQALKFVIDKLGLNMGILNNVFDIGKGFAKISF